ncbi:hypothetical protein F4824DRAFT_456143 [Ustulina deusta]|nr:hypothetical protein F4824DRAFT_456143 [Ustulina deusta]
MVRMCGDCGSVQRDAEERNLNSENFPEFSTSNDKKKALELAEYERNGLNEALRQI